MHGARNLVVAVIIILMAMGANYMYTDVPDGWERPWEVRIRLGLIRIVYDLVSIAKMCTHVSN